MKKTLLLALLLLFIGQVANAQDFKSTWLTFGTITFTATTTGPVAYTWQTVAPAAPASGSGTFVGPLVTITGLPFFVQVQLSIQPLNFKRIICNTNNDFQNAGIRSINQWGAVGWSSMENAFRFTNLTVVNASDTPNLSGVTSLSQMFAITSINSPFNINAWNVSTITNLSGMFRNCENFNQSLSNWNTSNVTNMSGMFEGASVFNLNLANWNTSNVINMSGMFTEAANFNRPIGNWNTANVTNMSEMFGVAFAGNLITVFNQNISS
jgi:surface protein